MAFIAAVLLKQCIGTDMAVEFVTDIFETQSYKVLCITIVLSVRLIADTQTVNENWC